MSAPQLDQFREIFAWDLTTSRAGALEGQEVGGEDNGRAEEFVWKKILKQNRRCCCCDIVAYKVPFLLAEGAEHVVLSGDSRNIVLNSHNETLRRLVRTLEPMKALDPQRYDEFTARFAALVADLVTWPACLPVSQMGGYGGGDVGYPIVGMVGSDESQLVVPRVAPDDKLWMQGKVRSIYGYARPRMDEALNAEILYFLNNPSSPPVAEESEEAAPLLPTARAMPTGGCLLMYSPQFARFVSGAEMPDPNTNLHFALCLLLKVPVIDRTGIIVDPTVKVRILNPIPKGSADNAKLDLALHYTTHRNIVNRLDIPIDALHKDSLLERAWEICQKTSLLRLIEQRTQNIFNLAAGLPHHERRIDLLWSGGIDSTTALVAFLRLPAAEYESEHVRVRILFNASSIAEFRELGNWILANCGLGRRVPHIELLRIPDESPIADNIDLTSGITVTGEYGDQIFGSILMAGAYKRDPTFIFHGTKQDRVRPVGSELQDPWQDGVHHRLREMNILREDRIDALMDLLKRQAKECRFLIRTKFDWLWWVNFSMKYQYVGLRLLNRVPDLNRDKANRVMHFFGGDDFQLWALSERNHMYKFPRKATNRIPHGFRAFPMYKILLKAYITTSVPQIRIRQRMDYFLNKEKVGSLKHVPSYNFAMDDQYNVFSFGGFSVSRDVMRGTYGDSLERFLYNGQVVVPAVEQPVQQVPDADGPVSFGPAPFPGGEEKNK